MAKYDTYTLTLQLGKDEQRVNLEVTMLFEDGDNAAIAIKNARELLKAEAVAMKAAGFIASIKQ